jgi:uncharacterized protein (TIGR00730 family)
VVIERVLVFCGSSPGARADYAHCAAQLGRLLAQRGLGLVYGGASVGLMGAVADAALQAGGEVIGVIPRGLVEREIGHPGLTELREVATMHERKALMAELADAVIALPGGSGTLDELFELFTWSQLGLHHKPIGLLDVAGYWRPLLVLLDHMVSERFLRAEHRDTLLVATDPAALLEELAGHRPRTADKWSDRQSVPNTRSPASPNPGRM